MTAVRLRFVSYSDDPITLYEGKPWDHTEIVLPNGEGYLGSVSPDGVAIRPVGYDAPFTRELFVDLPVSDEVANKFYETARGLIGTPYDELAILGFATHTDLHSKDHVICSAYVTIVCEKSGVFPGKLCWPAHEVDPAALLLVFSGLINIPDAA
jgi:hypothetical protein